MNSLSDLILGQSCIIQAISLTRNLIPKLNPNAPYNAPLSPVGCGFNVTMNWNALTDGEVKYVRSLYDGHELLFDLMSDPDELVRTRARFSARLHEVCTHVRCPHVCAQMLPHKRLIFQQLNAGMRRCLFGDKGL